MNCQIHLKALLVSKSFGDLIFSPFFSGVQATFILGNGSGFKDKGEEKLPVKQRPSKQNHF